jgi:dTDP-4-dehydrorhamnose reductase
MKYKNIFLTGGSGVLGSHIRSSGFLGTVKAPGIEDLDITDSDAIEKFIAENDFDAIIHCAALARVRQCEEDPVGAVKANVIGTANLVNAVKKSGRKIRFFHISTDGVYEGVKGNYSEKDPVAPYNTYCWTKLGAETAVNILSDFCIIRTGFFDPDNILYDDAADDVYSSKMPVKDLVKAIVELLESDFVGTVNVGTERKSDYDRMKEFKPDIKVCKFADITKGLNFKLAQDSSMDTSLWKELKEKWQQN